MPDDDRQDWVRGPGPHPPRDPHAEWQRERDLALTVPCPNCRVPKGVACVNRGGGNEPRLLVKSPAHHRRIRLADRAERLRRERA